MAQDAELERLKINQDQAFQRKQNAWQAQDKAWAQRSATRYVMDQAYQIKQRAYEVQRQAWDELQQVRDRNGCRIDSLNTQQEAAFHNMKSAFESATSAHESRDGQSARTYADEGHSYKVEAQTVTAERRQLVQEIRDAIDQQKATRPAFQKVKDEFDHAKSEYEQSKASHKQKQGEFSSAKTEFDRASSAFAFRLETVRLELKEYRDAKRLIALHAGVPSEYLDDVRITTASDGTVNIYFGGAGQADGSSHGHYVLNSDYNVTYQRDPFDAHGSQNFADYEERSPQISTGWEPRSSEPPYVGVIDGTDHVVSFKTGGPTGDHTLIADGDYSEDEKGFNAKHNHYGTRQEALPDSVGEDKYFAKDHGYYTGPDH